ncbi:MAG: FAD-dependent oxidoreductase [Kiloniellales bacterium]|nr:FAD-dependent oxidoreductase [Kiloniellales bacterium]
MSSKESLRPDLCIIGGGSGGLSVAAGAAQMGAEVVLIEKAEMGGDCLNYGCVPSKALLAASHSAHNVREGARFGVNGHEPAIDFQKVHDHVHGVIGAIAPHDSVERFEDLGVRVIQAAARFTAPDEVVAGDVTVRAKRFVIATGSSPAVPPIEGLDQVPFLTNETIFDLTERPDHLIVIGGGPIGVEMAQAHRGLGSEVSLLEVFSILAKDDSDAVAVVRERLVRDGIALHERIKIKRVEARGNGIAVILESESGVEETILGSHLLVAAGRRANVANLGLEAAGVAYSPKGIEVDARLRSSNKRIFAIGDVAGGFQFTHMAGYHAGIVIRNALFKLPAKAKYHAVPWVTYSDPELAHVGLGEDAARDRHGEVKAVTFPFAENDRAQAERETEGFIKVVVGKKGKVLGATIVGAHAGELILPWVLAVDQGLKIGTMASIIAPYPTRSEVSKRVAGSYFTPALFGERTRKVVRFLQRLG